LIANKFKYLVFSAITIVSFSCGSETSSNEKQDSEKEAGKGAVTKLETFSVRGNISDANGRQFFLYKYGGAQPVKLDSMVIENDQFSFETKTNGYQFYGVGFDLSQAVSLLVKTGVEITLDGSAENWMKSASVKGSENSEIIAKYTSHRFEYFEQLQLLQQEYQTAMNGDPAQQIAITKKADSIQKAFAQFKINFINEHKDLPGVYAAAPDINDPMRDLELIKIIETTVSKHMPGSNYSKGLQETINKVNQAKMQAQMQTKQAPQGIPPGSEAPDLAIANPEGKTIKLSDLRGQVVLLDFWASWCKPCRMENPNVVKLYNEYKDKGFTVYSVSFDNNKDKWVNAIAKDGLVWPNHVSELKGWQSNGGAIYKVNSIPKTYLIDKDGTIIASDLRGQNLENKLKEIFGS